ncbi:MAG: hypothetical protein FWG66_13260 [Spirochaetes bacterium]|nr:hypothetical protein [Spirochaetota bacterium]
MTTNKKQRLALACLAMLLTVTTAFTACAGNTARASEDTDTILPGFVQTFLESVPENVFVGIGFSREQNADTARFDSAIMATAFLFNWHFGYTFVNPLSPDIPQTSSGQTLDRVESLIRDYSSRDLSFREQLSVSASFFQPQTDGSQMINFFREFYQTDGDAPVYFMVIANGNTRVAFQDTDTDGTVWTVVFLDETDAVVEGEPDTIVGGMPQPVANFLSAPLNELFAVGVARMSDTRFSRLVAEHRARVEIGRALNEYMQGMISGFGDFESTNEIRVTDPTDVSGTRTVFQHIEPDGTAWVVVALDADRASRYREGNTRGLTWERTTDFNWP